MKKSIFKLNREGYKVETKECSICLSIPLPNLSSGGN